MFTPDPLNPEFALDEEGRLYVHTLLEMPDAVIDIGYSLVPPEAH